jgi:hypothetical protein
MNPVGRVVPFPTLPTPRDAPVGLVAPLGDGDVDDNGSVSESLALPLSPEDELSSSVDEPPLEELTGVLVVVCVVAGVVVAVVAGVVVGVVVAVVAGAATMSAAMSAMAALYRLSDRGAYPTGRVVLVCE